MYAVSQSDWVRPNQAVHNPNELGAEVEGINQSPHYDKTNALFKLANYSRKILRFIREKCSFATKYTASEQAFFSAQLATRQLFSVWSKTNPFLQYDPDNI